jgi:isocitrate dehydrogenase
MTSETSPDIIYTIVDEAPELASASLLPIIKGFSSVAGITVGTKDISLAGRVLAAFPDYLKVEQQVSNDLEELGKVVLKPSANIIKLPNVSASIPQLMAAIGELQEQGYNLPHYPEFPSNKEEEGIKARYDELKGSAVNPVLREGNSDRRAAKAVKRYAMSNPHSMGKWLRSSKTRVSCMKGNDFYSNEKSATIQERQSGKAQIVFEDLNGLKEILKDNFLLHEGSVVDATFMDVIELRHFFKEQIKLAKDLNILFSLHLKSTMMKVSDPIIFGHAVSVFFEEVFHKYASELTLLGVSPNSGLGEILKCIEGRAEIADHFRQVISSQPELYMVDSNRGITNLHVPSDVIIDASMPAIIRAGGKGWGADGQAKDTNCVIPDSCYASIYDEAIQYFIDTGELDPSTSGSVDNVGLMAQKAEEYGSHPTTFEIQMDGIIKIVLESGDVLHEHSVKKGDIWRASTSRKAPIENWVNLGIERQRVTGSPAIFWLDANRAHDAQLINCVTLILNSKGLSGKFQILSPRQATRLSLKTIRNGKDIIAITGNVLRDYLTDLFPILELGTSAKMLSIVKLMNGGGLFETGAGGSAPKHVQQLVKENHLRWDSLGEFCALGESLRFFSDNMHNKRAAIMGDAVDSATQAVLDYNKSPMRKVGQLDNRSSHFYFALYWSEALAKQSLDYSLASYFAPIAQKLKEKESVIINELSASQGDKIDLSGYYHPDPIKVLKTMRPSKTFNKIIDAL